MADFLGILHPHMMIIQYLRNPKNWLKKISFNKYNTQGNEILFSYEIWKIGRIILFSKLSEASESKHTQADRKNCSVDPLVVKC